MTLGPLGFSPQTKGAEPSIHLSERVLLPLIGGAFPQNLGLFYKLPDADRTSAVDALEFCIEVPVSRGGVFVLEQWTTDFGQRVGAARKIADAVVDVICILPLVSPIDVQRTYMAHFVVVQKQPGNGAADNDELVTEAAENLAISIKTDFTAAVVRSS